MIKVTKGKEPQVLIDNKAQWTSDLVALVKKYGSYESIPKNEKSDAIKNYAHPDITAALLGRGGKAKCIYCESYVDITGYANIEHYYPKSLYPNETFSWDNLFVGCALCNTPKNNFDTSRKPFIHPVNDNPEDYLTFDELNYVPKFTSGTAYEKAKNLIEACKLEERTALVREHANVLCAFLDTRNMIVAKITHYNGIKSEKSKILDAMGLLKSLMVLNDEASDDAHFAGYMRYLLRKYVEVKDAVAIVNSHKDDLGIPGGFQWSFSFI
jgi:uncharacterized protein (TIGR02646 family)